MKIIRSNQLFQNKQGAILKNNLQESRGFETIVGGKEGIRTLDTVTRIHAFQAVATNNDP